MCVRNTFLFLQRVVNEIIVLVPVNTRLIVVGGNDINGDLHIIKKEASLIREWEKGGRNRMILILCLSRQV